MPTRRLLGVLALTALVGAGCTVSDDGDDDPATDAGDGGPVVGVTEDTVKLGFLGFDETMLADLGVEADTPPAEDLVSALTDAQNGRGGVAGRQIELVFEPFVPIGAAEAEAACVALTEDDPVFLAIGNMIGDTPLCFTEDHETPYLGLWGLSPERERRSAAPFLALEMADHRQRLAGAEALRAEGLLDGKVALYWIAQDDAMIRESVLPDLTDMGIDVVEEVSLEDFGDDQAAIDQAADVAAERIQASGADTVLTLSAYGPLVPAFQRAGWLPERILGVTQHGLSADYNSNAGITSESLERITIASQYKPSKEEFLDDTALTDCLDDYAAADPEAADASSATREWLNGAAQLCGAFQLFVEAADAAGEDLTPASWVAGAESLGSLELAGIPIGSVGEGKHDVNDGVGMYSYDADSGEMMASGEPTEAGV